MSLIYRYIISLLLVMLSFLVAAQEKLPRQTFVRVGYDLSRLTLPLFYDYGLKGMEFSLDSEVKYRYFPTFELGYNKIEDNTDNHQYDLYGWYYRIGMDYNMLNYKHRFDRNIFYIGARYAFTQYDHAAPSITIANVWGSHETSFAQSSLAAQWFEGVIGMRGELVTNLYLGFTIRVKAMLSHSDYNDFTPYWVPGYGDPNKGIALGLSYSIFYAIPIKSIKPQL